MQATNPTVNAIAAPVALGTAAASAAGALLLLGAERAMPFGCPFLALTGWACPLCGGTRSTAELARGDLSAALDLNAFTTVGQLALTALWLAWLLARLQGRPLGTAPPAAVWWAVVALGVMFAVVRNVPGPTSALAP